jgi:hypothetical protein
MTIYRIDGQLYQNGELVQSHSDDTTQTTTTTETPGQVGAPDDDLTWQDVLDAAHDIYEMVSDPKESIVGDVVEGWLEAFGADEIGPEVGKAITDFMNDVFGSGSAGFQMVGPSELEGSMLGPNGELMIFNPETGEYEYADDQEKGSTSLTDNMGIIANPQGNDDQHGDQHDHDTDNGDHTGTTPDNEGDPKEPDPAPGAPDGDMPNPDSGPGSPTSTPNPDGDDGEGNEGSHHGVPVGHGASGGGGGDGEGEGPGRLGLSQQLSGSGNNSQQGGTGDPSHGPHDPGEEMPNPEDGRGGNPTSNVAHGAHDFWTQAAGASQGVATGQHGSTVAVSDHASAIAVTFNAAVTTSAHDLTGALSGASGHDDSAHTASVGAHATTAVGSELHGELGTSTLHDTLALHGASFATQMHV